MLLSPILRELEAYAQGVAAQPKRVVFLLQNHGLQSWAVKPPELPRDDKLGVPKLVDRSLADLSLADDLSPLSEFKDRLSIIQGLSPDRVLGRVNATLEVFSHGIAYPLGALLAAALAELIGVRGGIFVGWAGMAASILLLVFSPLPRVRKISDVPALEA